MTRRPIKRHQFTEQERRNAYLDTEQAYLLLRRALLLLTKAHAYHAAAKVRAARKSVEGAHRHAARMLPTKGPTQ